MHLAQSLGLHASVLVKGFLVEMDLHDVGLGGAVYS